MIRSIIIFICALGLFGCKKKDDPKPPGQVQLVFPEKNSECTTGVDQGENTSQVEFRWQLADNTKTYELRVTNINTGIVQTVSTASTSASLPLIKGQPYSWLVRSRNNQTSETISSETWSFYNSGSQTTFAPFPAEILSPKMSEKVFRDINNDVTLSWSGSDLDDDIAAFEIYLSKVNPPTDLINTLSSETYSLKVDVDSGAVYYWSVVTKDAEGNATSSGVYSFVVL